MPDLGTHIALGYWILKFPLSRVFSSRIYIPVFLFGCLLPDLIYKTGEIIFPFDYYWFFNSFHTPSSLIFQCITISLLFESGIRKTVFLCLSGGTSSHLFLDSLQSHISGGNYFWLYPFSNWTGEFGLFPVHIWPPLLAGSIMLVLSSHLLQKWIRYNKKRHD